MSELKEEETPRFELGYWKIQGLAQPIRYLLAYCGHSNFKDVTYEPNNREEWFKVKETLGLDFPNLPYLRDNVTGAYITQSSAIMRYIGKVFNIGSSNPNESVYEDMIYEAVFDFTRPFFMLCYSPDFNEKKESFIKDCPNRLKEFEDYLSKKGKWFGGNNICLADFRFYTFVSFHVRLHPKLLDNLVNCKRHFNEFKQLEKIKKYMSSHDPSKLPLVGAGASFGGP